MKIIDNTIYNIINITRNKDFLNLINRIGGIDNYNIIIPNLYLGNINYAHNNDFLKKNKIEAVLNCTENEPFNEYFDNKYKYRLAINDSKKEDNITKFKDEIVNSINFIEYCIDNNIPIYVHCFWGYMRSATVVAAYLIKKYNITSKDAINIMKEHRPYSMSSLYNFNEILEYIESIYLYPGINCAI